MGIAPDAAATPSWYGHCTEVAVLPLLPPAVRSRYGAWTLVNAAAVSVGRKTSIVPPPAAVS